MPENFKGVCRLCLSKGEFMFPIFNKHLKSETPLRVKILSCASIEIFADDELPPEICHLCAHQVEKSFYFRTVCQKSDATLRLQLNQCENEVIPEDTSVRNLEVNNTKWQSDWLDKKTSIHQEKNEDILCFPDNQVCENVINVFVCFVCSLGFTAYDILIEHLSKSHPDITSLHCKSCKIYFSDANEYKVHLNLKHTFNCNQCDHVFKYEKNLETHLQSHSVEVFSCQYCKKVFDKQFDLKQHELSHLDKICQYCCKLFQTKEEYNDHMKSCKESYYCKFCSQSFQVIKDLIEHVNQCHSSSKNHSCKNCSKTFGKWEDMQQHSCEILSEKQLQCKYCQQIFKEMAQLDSHILSEHNGELLACKFCTKSFTLKTTLKRHEKSHSTLKPYQCKYCPRRFKDNSTCIVHIRTHTGEHPFQCQECHKDFKQLANLKMHTYRHHKINNKVTEEKSEIIKQSEHVYDDLYNSSIIDNFSSEGDKSFQQIDNDIPPSFTENSALLTDHH